MKVATFWFLTAVTVLLGLLLLYSQVFPQACVSCLPASWLIRTITDGCDTIYKEQHTQVRFPAPPEQK
jgi:hypothetical protein